jgi:hypothetical protein
LNPGTVIGLNKYSLIGSLDLQRSSDDWAVQGPPQGVSFGTFVDADFLFPPGPQNNGDGHISNVNGETVILPTVENETFDRIYIAVSAPRLFRSSTFSLVPKVYYYQTCRKRSFSGKSCFQPPH